MTFAFTERNDVERRRLQELVARLSDRDLSVSLDGGWTVSAVLAHLAFWDRAAIAILDAWERDGFQQPLWFDVSEINDAALPGWLLIPPKDAARQVLAVAAEVDERTAQVSPHLIPAIVSGGRERVLDRSIHRVEHLNEVEEVLRRRASS